MASSIEDNWIALLAEMEEICDEIGRDRPQIVVVTKTRSDDEVQQAIDAGVSHLAENYAQEFETRAQKFPNVDWHFVGHLQRRHAASVTPYAKIIHTLDRKKLVDRLLHFDYTGNNFIQVNISGEASKYGIDYEREIVKELLDYGRKKGLKISGLMSIGNLDWDGTTTFEEFSKFVDFGFSLGLEQMSLGMSDDWQLAVRAGSTHLRIGTAIFGPRS